ncbi:MAG: Fe-S protein assembly co-chaperone HscB [Saprospiraceae bacterium]|nr:Fe-S protein assembly co-chaperone HscB [Saprospiraceae bacterium]MDW8230233.1 Fe-S protein assembly co-chaperone HscB [Saprospiraceae bacterium]
MNYFEFFGLPVAFRLDEAQLRRRFYQNSKKYHPDFHTLASPEEQEEMLRLSTLNNEAFQTLADPDRRMRYVLEIKGLLEGEGQQQVPQEFLLEMMDINEALMELEMDYDDRRFEQTAQAVAEWERALDEAIAPILDRYADDSPDSRGDLLQVRDYFLKKRYLLRIREKLATFAAR